MNTLLLFFNVFKLGNASLTTIHETQLQRLQHLVDYSRKHSRYFKDLYNTVPEKITDISQLPITEKPVLMQHFNEWVTDKILHIEKIREFISKKETIGDMYKYKYYVCTTSGSTGEPAVIIHDKQSRAVYYAIGLFRNLLPRIPITKFLTRFKMAAFLATGGHFLGYTTMVNRSKKSKWRQSLQKIYSVFTPITDIVKKLNIFQPDIIGGYPTVMYILAKEQLKKRLSIHPYVITSAGETLHPYMRKTMEKAFHCEVINSYGSSEVPGLTFECKYHNLHVNSDWYILETTENNTILVTNLSNFVQPIIRYRMSDAVIFVDEPCKCSSPYPMIHVVGRDDEILHFTSTEGKTVDIVPLSISTVVEETEGVYQCQIIQKTAKHIAVRVKVYEDSDDKSVKESVQVNVQKFLQSQNLSNVKVEISNELPQINPKSGKFKSVIAEV